MLRFFGITFLLVIVGGQNGQKRSLWVKQLRKSEVNYRQEEKKILDTVMGPSVYDARIRPSGMNDTDAATLVTVNLFVRSFSKIDDVKMEYTFQITMRQSWVDQRLQYEHIKEQKKIPLNRIRYLTMTDASKIWMPDTFFRNEKIGSFHTILQPNLYIRIFPDGTVLYSIRVSLTAACSMHLALFPLDEQTCNLFIASYGWTKNDLEYSWYERGPVQIPGNLSLPGGFKLGGYNNSYCDVVTATGEYSCLQVDLTFARQLSFFIVTVYIPCSMTVSVSWLSFWLDHKAVPARVALGVTTLLAMSTTQASIQNSLPPVAYTKAIDVWSGVCVVFVFSALLEYALVNYASRSDAQRSAKQKERREQELEKCKFNAEIMEEPGLGLNMARNILQDPLMRRLERCHMVPVGHIVHTSPHVSGLGTSGLTRVGYQEKQNFVKRWFTQRYRNFQFGAKKIDVFSRFGFPLVFFIFNIWYWSYYLTQEHKQY